MMMTETNTTWPEYAARARLASYGAMLLVGDVEGITNGADRFPSALEQHRAGFRLLEAAGGPGALDEEAYRFVLTHVAQTPLEELDEACAYVRQELKLRWFPVSFHLPDEPFEPGTQFTLSRLASEPVESARAMTLDEMTAVSARQEIQS